MAIGYTIRFVTNIAANHLSVLLLAVQFKSSPGKTYPMLDYDYASPEVKRAFDWYDWGKGHCPFNERNWEDYLKDAWVEAPEPAAEALGLRINYCAAHGIGC